MIFYFSGTGNSLYIAKNIADNQKEKIISISKEMYLKKDIYEYELKSNENIVFVYPIYAWAPPKMVLEFIDKIKLKNYNDNYTIAVASCGENIGNSMNLLSNVLNNKGISLNSGFSIAMPNNYMVMGDVEPKDNIPKLIKEANTTLDKINNIINNKVDNVFQIEKGPMPGVMTKVINPLFNMNAINTKKFYADDNCNGCKICENICNTKTIKVSDKPIWGKECTGCFACINYCPQKSIQFGKATIKKGRYINPNIDINEMMK